MSYRLINFAGGDVRDKIKVLHVYKTYYPDTDGGIEKVLQQLMLNLNKMNVENRLLVLSEKCEPAIIQYPEGQVIRCPVTLEIASNPMSVKALATFRQQMQWADVVHYQFPWPFADLLHILSRVPKPSVVSYQSDIVRQKGLMKLYRPLMLRFLENVNFVCASSENYLQSSLILKRLENKPLVIPNGIDDLTLEDVSVSCLDKWRSYAGERFFLFVGVLRYYKGIHTLLKAAKLNGLPVIIAGTGPEMKNLQAEAQALGVDKVRFVGRISEEDKRALLQLCCAFVFPSHLRSEAFGMSLVEACIYGKPMISCEIGTGTSFVNLHEKTGYVVRPENEIALAEAMKKIYKDPQNSRNLGLQARAHYEKNFTAVGMAKKYRSVYENALGLK